MFFYIFSPNSNSSFSSIISNCEGIIVLIYLESFNSSKLVSALFLFFFRLLGRFLDFFTISNEFYDFFYFGCFLPFFSNERALFLLIFRNSFKLLSLLYYKLLLFILSLLNCLNAWLTLFSLYSLIILLSPIISLRF